jgi:protein arginine kinase activator
MKMCEECGCRPANIHLTQIVDNVSQSIHLCEQCAGKRGINMSIDETPAPSVPFEDRECGVCRMTLSNFRKQGQLGCPSCYQAFEAEIDELLLQVHGSTEHRGKGYRTTNIDECVVRDISELRALLDAAIRNEQFESAALLRDAIHGIGETDRK